MAEFDPKKANNDDWGVIGGGAVVLISSFFAWYGTSGAGAFDASASGWDSGFLALLAILLCTAAAAWVAFRVFGSGNAPDMPVGPNLLALVLAGVGAVFILLRLVTFERESVGPISVGPKFGVFIALLAAIAQAFFAWRLFKASGEQMAVDKSRMPSRPAAAGAGPVDGGHAGYAGPPAGYAPPPAPPAGYAAPQAHPGYAAPPAAPSYDDTGQTSAGYAEGAQPGYGSAQRDPNQPPPPNA